MTATSPSTRHHTEFSARRTRLETPEPLPAPRRPPHSARRKADALLLSGHARAVRATDPGFPDRYSNSTSLRASVLTSALARPLIIQGNISMTRQSHSRAGSEVALSPCPAQAEVKKENAICSSRVRSAKFLFSSVARRQRGSCQRSPCPRSEMIPTGKHAQIVDLKEEKIYARLALNYR